MIFTQIQPDLYVPTPPSNIYSPQNNLDDHPNPDSSTSTAASNTIHPPRKCSAAVNIVSTPRLPPEEALDKGFIQPLATELPNPLLPRLYAASIVRNPMEENEAEMVCGAPFDRDLRYLQVNDDWGRDPSGQLRELEISKAGVTLLPRHEERPNRQRAYREDWARYYMRERIGGFLYRDELAYIPFDMECCGQDYSTTSNLNTHYSKHHSPYLPLVIKPGSRYGFWLPFVGKKRSKSAAMQWFRNMSREQQVDVLLLDSDDNDNVVDLQLTQDLFNHAYLEASQQ